jgi:uncharacterized protein (DUF433 family)
MTRVRTGGRPTRADDERLLAWLAARDAGWSHARIAAHWGVTARAVQNAISKVNLAARAAEGGCD